MAAARQGKTRISPLSALAFTIALNAALVAVIFPILPGTSEVEGEIIENSLTGSAVAAAVLISLLTGSLLGAYLYLSQTSEVSNSWRLAMVGLLVIVTVAASKVFLSLTLPDNDRLYLAYIFPVAATSMLLATLLDEGLAVLVAALLALLVTFVGYYQPDARAQLGASPLEAFQMASVFLTSSLVGLSAVHRAERMNRYLVAGGMVGLTSFVGLLAFWLLDPAKEGVDLPWMMIASALNGGASAVITVGALVVLGYIFGITTRVQLMELAQLSHPLLRELQEKAPGTFHHSVIVGNLAERAADLVNADPLLVRVGCYFHDIGKLAQPGYYIENQLDDTNPHDTLDSDSSARVITQHVRLGVELAKRHHIPAQVRAFIPEHHGTRLVTYFYRKASQKDPNIDPDKFRYPGPKPQSRETAIVMLADSVEAVVRSSQDRTQERIEALVDAVINERVAEGQLDECDLTLRDLRTIARSFKATLRGIYHPRIEYPAPTKRELEAVGTGSLIHTPASPVDGTASPLESQ
ncbi:MAG TPA: HDIG domain-containing protein [Dehalococcoidia bacterium]|nr:HDIG domain-containing protein [Dehalococcoidia bacterium]